MSAGHGRRLAARPAEGNPRLKLETAFSIDTSSIKYGAGVTREAGYEMRRMGARRVMVVTDPRLSASDPVSTVLASLKGEGVEAVLYDEVRVEPTDVSFKEAIVFAEQGAFDGYVAVGGGSAIDTAKAAIALQRDGRVFEAPHELERVRNSPGVVHGVLLANRELSAEGL